MNFDPWPGFRCHPQCRPETLLHEFEAVLSDARDERPIQHFLAQNPSLLMTLLPPGGDAWCFDRPRLGGQYVPDFLLCTRNSNGFEWVLVEIESPTKKLLTQAGLPSSKLNEALGQIRDWRSWLRVNIAYAHQQLSLTGLTAEAKGFVVMSRRSALDPRHAKRYRELSDAQTSIMTYDRLLDGISNGRVLSGATHE